MTSSHNHKSDKPGAGVTGTNVAGSIDADLAALGLEVPTEYAHKSDVAADDGAWMEAHIAKFHAPGPVPEPPPSGRGIP